MPKPQPKPTIGSRLWDVMFTLAYPIIAVFTFALTVLVSVFSGISQGIVWLLNSFSRKA